MTMNEINNMRETYLMLRDKRDQLMDIKNSIGDNILELNDMIRDLQDKMMEAEKLKVEIKNG